MSTLPRARSTLPGPRSTLRRSNLHPTWIRSAPYAKAPRTLPRSNQHPTWIRSAPYAKAPRTLLRAPGTRRLVLSWRSSGFSTRSMSHAPTAALDARHTAVRSALAARSLDALVVTSLPNVLYLTNFTGSAAIAVITSDGLYFITDFRYFTAVDELKGTPHEPPAFELVKVKESYDATLAGVLAAQAGHQIGFEAANLTVS